MTAGEPQEFTVDIAHGGPNILEFEAEPLCRRADRDQQPRRRFDRGHPREPPRSARLRRAACRRAHLAEPLEVRRRGRPRPLHHPAAAGEAGRHADQPAVADRLPDPRAVLGEDRRVRPDHLRPLPAPRRAADPLLRQHRPLRPRRRRGADRRRSRLRRRRQPLRHAAVAGAAGGADRHDHGEALLRRRDRGGPPPSGDARPRRFGLRAAALGPLVPADRRRGADRGHRGDGRRRQEAAPHPQPGRTGARRAPSLGPGLALGAELRGRRAACRSAYAVSPIG